MFLSRYASFSKSVIIWQMNIMRLPIEHMVHILFEHRSSRLLQKLSNNTTAIPYHYNDLTVPVPLETKEIWKKGTNPFTRNKGSAPDQSVWPLSCRAPRSDSSHYNFRYRHISSNGDKI